MNKPQLKSYLKERFAMDLFEFVKQNVGVGYLHNYEIPSIINVGPPLTGKARNNFGIKRAGALLRQFELTQGKGAVEIYKKMIGKPNNLRCGSQFLIMAHVKLEAPTSRFIY